MGIAPLEPPGWFDGMGRRTDSDGRFEEGLVAGGYAITITAIAFRPETKEVLVEAGETLELTFVLEEAP